MTVSERCGENTAHIGTSFDLEELLTTHPEHGTWIIDEAAFYDEQLAYVANRESRERGLIFINPSLIPGVRRETFNATALPRLDMGHRRRYRSPLYGADS